MPLAKAIPPDGTAQIIEQDDQAKVVVAGQDLGLTLRTVRHDTLTLGNALDVPARSDVIVRFRRASPDAKKHLRDRRISYASDQGEIFVLDPPVAIHQSAPPRKRLAVAGPSPGTRPFATKASRVSRWLLNHPRQVVNVRQLARHTDLSEGAVSGIVRELHDRMLLEVTRNPDDARERLVRLEQPGPLLDAWEREWELRHIRTIEWDIGTGSVRKTLENTREAASADPTLSWAVGGTSGVAEIVRVVEPADVLLWVREDEVAVWETLLVPARGHGRPGTLRLAISPDTYMFALAESRDGIQVADPAQLYLDCTRQGERALEAADAIRRQMRW